MCTPPSGPRTLFLFWFYLQNDAFGASLLSNLAACFVVLCCFDIINLYNTTYKFGQVGFDFGLEQSLVNVLGNC
ncbi:hypothetical protein F5Y03DRAFT_365837 [Xylaria venustula]|nr:hypothetical protein F5Y03DRAFT_365837 [Xylaria venustula]